MLPEISRLILCDEIMKTSSKEWQKSVILLNNSIGKLSLLIRCKMGVINIKSRKLIDSEAVDLCNVISLIRYSA
jgi:hypothetical protein